MNWIDSMDKSNKFWKVEFDELPTTLKMIRSLEESNLQKPYYAVALLIPALCLWSSNQKMAIDIINFLKGPRGLTMREIHLIDDCLGGKEYLPFSYFEGSTPENGYKPSKPYTITISTVPTSLKKVRYAKFYLQSSGVDNPSPIKVRQKPSSREWFLWR